MSCLSPFEIARFSESGDLPADRLSHIAECDHCGALLAEAQSPPDIRSFLLKMEDPKPILADSQVPGNPTQSKLLRVLVPSLVCLSLILIVSVIQMNVERRKVASRRQAELKQIARNKPDSQEAQGAKSRIGNSDIDLINSAKREKSRSVDGEQVNTQDRLDGVENWTEKDIIEWAFHLGAGTKEDLVFLFRKCARLDLREAIPIAIFYGSSTRKTEQAIAARDLLDQYSDKVIEDSIYEFAPRTTLGTEFFLNRFRTSKVQLQRSSDGNK